MFLVFAWAAKTRSTTKMLFILHFLSDPESEPTRSPESDSESESESEQPHHDSAPLVTVKDRIQRLLNIDFSVVFRHRSSQSDVYDRVTMTFCREHVELSVSYAAEENADQEAVRVPA